MAGYYGIPNFSRTDPRIQEAFPLSYEDIMRSRSIRDGHMPESFSGGGLSKEDIVQQQQLTPFEMLMAQLGNPLAQGRVTKQDERRAMNQSPYTAQIQEIRRQIAQAGAQSQQNIADVRSWFGQYAGQMKGGAKANRKAGKAALRGNKRDLAGVLESGIVGDPTIRGNMAGAAADEARYLRSSNLASGQFDQRMIADAQRQSAYQALVQQRLGAQAQMDLRSQIPGLQAQRSASVQEGLSQGQDDRFQQWASIMNMLPQEQRAEMLGFPPEQDAEAQFEWRDRLGEALGGVTPTFASEDESGNKKTSSAYRGFNDLLDAYKNAATGAGLDINDPAVRDAYRRYVAAYVLQNWNPYAASQGMPEWQLQGDRFRNK
jgi:hypothetical protein